jgi:hypothetical protein
MAGWPWPPCHFVYEDWKVAKMLRKIIGGSITLAACFAAFGVANFASAATLTQPTGTTVATETKFKATNIGNLVFTFGSNTWICSNDVLTGTITNNTSEVEGTIETASFKGTEAEEKCPTSLGPARLTTAGGSTFLGTPWCMTAGAEDKLSIRGNSCGGKARAITFAFDLIIFGTAVECKYERTTATGPITGTYTTDTTGDAIGTILPAGSAVAPESANPFACPGAGALEVKFTLETDPALGSSSPMYIS